MAYNTTKSKYSPNASKEEVTTMQAAFKLTGHLRNEGNLTVPPNDLLMTLLSNESFSATQSADAVDMLATMQSTMESFSQLNPIGRDEKGNGIHFTGHQLEAARFALASAMNPRASLTRAGHKVQYKSSGPLDVFIPDNSGLDPSKLGPRSLEAYDTKPNDETLNFTAAFAIATATQNKFGELFYKTINMSPDQYAVEMEIPLISVHPQVRHELEKKLASFQKQNIVNAEIDHTILDNDTLKIVPVYREQTKDQFVDPALIAVTETVLESGEKIQTAPLRTNYRSTLFRVAQTDAQLAKGMLDQTDALDPGAKLDAVYIQFGTGSAAEVVRIDTQGAPMNQFVESVQGMTRMMQLNFTTDSTCISETTTLLDGTPSVLLAAFQGPTANKAWLSFSISSQIDLETSNYEVTPGTIVVNTIRNAQDLELDLDGAGQTAMVTLFNSAKVIAVDIDARKVNSNLRELGQLANFNTYRQVYGVALGSPLAVQRPITNGDAQDALHAAALSYLCKVRQSNKAVTQLISEADTLRQYHKRTTFLGRSPEVMGISAYLVEPRLEEMEVDLLEVITTTAQHERYSDITSYLTDTVTIMAYKLWQKSNWQAAANLLEGTEAAAPEVALGTDLVLSQYLMIQGDTRTVGPDFSYKKASSPDLRVRDKIFIALNYPSANPGVPHPLDHGMMITKPEVVAALNLSRSAHSRELIVHPTFRHITLSPILGVITVKNLDAALTQKATLGVNVNNAADFPSQPVDPVTP